MIVTVQNTTPYFGLPRDWAKLEQTKAVADGQPLTPVLSWQALQKFTTTQLRKTLGAGAESEAIVGDFTWLWLALRNQVRVEASRVAADGSGNSAFTDMQVWIRAYVRADVVIGQPSAFTYMSGITT